MPTVIKETGLTSSGFWTDSIACTFFDGMIQMIGGATGAIVPIQTHQVIDRLGVTQHSYTAPWTASAEPQISCINGKLTLCGATTHFEIWEFDVASGYASGSWTQLSTDFSGDIGQRKMAGFADYGGYFYIFGGWGRTDAYKTNDFSTWTLVGSLPANISKLSACGSCVHNGKIYLVGGCDNMATEDSTGFYAAARSGYVYEFDPSDDSYTLLTTDTAKFGTIWPNVISDGTYLYAKPGLLASGLNDRGLYRSTDGITWETISEVDGMATMCERHAAGVVTDGVDAYLLAGYACNDLWKLS